LSEPSEVEWGRLVSGPCRGGDARVLLRTHVEGVSRLFVAVFFRARVRKAAPTTILCELDWIGTMVVVVSGPFRAEEVQFYRSATSRQPSSTWSHAIFTRWPISAHRAFFPAEKARVSRNVRKRPADVRGRPKRAVRAHTKRATTLIAPTEAYELPLPVSLRSAARQPRLCILRIPTPNGLSPDRLAPQQ